MTRNEKRLAVLIVGANLALGITLARKAELGQLFQSEDGRAAAAASSSPAFALAPEELPTDAHPTPTPKD